MTTIITTITNTVSINLERAHGLEPCKRWVAIIRLDRFGMARIKFGSRLGTRTLISLVRSEVSCIHWTNQPKIRGTLTEAALAGRLC